MISKCQSKRTLLQRKYLESQGIPWLSCYSWEQRKLGEVGKARSGVGFPDTEQGGSSGTPFFKVSDMNNDGNENEMNVANNYVTDAQIAARRWSPIEEVPAIFFAKVGAAVMLNRKRLCRFPFLLDNNTMAYSLSKDQWDADFAKALFETVDLTTLVQVGALPSYNASDVEAMEIMLPEIPEQRQIGAYFRQLDNLITLHQRQRKNSMRNCSCLPFSWEQRKVGEVSKRVIVGLATSVTPYYREEGVPILRNLNIKENYLDDTDILFLDRPYAESQVSKQIHAGDVLTVHTGYIGISCVVPEKYDNCLTFTTLITTTDDAVLEGAFLAQYLNSEIGMSAVQAVTTQGGRQNLNTNDFVKVEIRYPSLAEQSKICAVLSRIDNLITLHQREQIFINLEVHDVRSGKKHRFIL